MSASSTAAKIASAALFPLMRQRLPERFRGSWPIIATAAAAAAGQGPAWMPLIYHAATLELDDVGPPPAMKQPPIERWKDDLPRRKVVRQLKETLVKSTILVGVGHCIEASFSLGNCLEEGDKDDTFVRQQFDVDGQAHERGSTALQNVYRHNNAPIQERMRELGLHDIQWLGPAVTYGQFLSPVRGRPEFPRAALSFSETEIVVLTCLMAKHAHREVLWHLRGCLRSGMTPDEVEGCQQAIEACLEAVEKAAGVATRQPMPRVTDVVEEDDLT